LLVPCGASDRPKQWPSAACSAAVSSVAKSPTAPKRLSFTLTGSKSANSNIGIAAIIKRPW